MFGFLKKKFGKSVDESKPVEQAAEEQAAAEVPAEDLAGAQAPVEPPVETPAFEEARADTVTAEAAHDAGDSDALLHRIRRDADGALLAQARTIWN